MALIVLDLVFFLFVSGHWLTIELAAGSLWNSLMGMHRFALFTSFIVFILKVIGVVMKIPAVYFIWSHRKLGGVYAAETHPDASRSGIYFDN